MSNCSARLIVLRAIICDLHDFENTEKYHYHRSEITQIYTLSAKTNYCCNYGRLTIYRRTIQNLHEWLRVTFIKCCVISSIVILKICECVFNLSTESAPSDMLQVVEKPVMSQAACRNIYGSNDFHESSMICAGFPEGGKDPCKVCYTQIPKFTDLTLDNLQILSSTIQRCF